MFKNVANYDYVQPMLDYKNIESATDVSTFRPDAEQVRALKFNPQGGSNTSPVYDYPNGYDFETDNVSDLIVAIRSGRLDKADVKRLKEQIENEAKSDKALKDSNALMNAIQSTLGVSENN